jgi:hypothetical protein
LTARGRSRVARTASFTRSAVVWLFAAAALLLLPWSVLLATRLPSRHLSAHWDLAWSGFDVALAGTLAAVALCAWRGSPWLEGAASAAAALLICDAWFDLLTAATGKELVIAALEAALVEVPMALLCLLIARRAEQAWRNASRAGRVPAGLLRNGRPGARAGQFAPAVGTDAATEDPV